MADADLPLRPMRSDWSDAFAAMPLEPAPADGWARLSARLTSGSVPSAGSGRASASNVRRRPGMRLALAAAASIAIALPAAWWLGMSLRAPLHRPVAGARAAVASNRAPATASQRYARPPVTGTARADAATTTRATATASAPATATPPASTTATGVGAGGPRPVSSTPRLPRRVATAPATPTATPPATAVDQAPDGLIATTAIAPSDTVGSATAHAAATATATDDPGSRIDALRQASARLEALVAYARDDRMSSAPAAVVSASLDDRIRLIDAALMQPGLDDTLRSSLWSERVGALQELASLEGTQRWMAAHGTSMDAVARVD